VSKKLKSNTSKDEIKALIAQPKKLLDMNSSVLTQVHFVANKIQYTGSAGYRKWFNLGISEFRLLGVIANKPGATGADISEIMGLDVAAISRTLNKMKQNKLVVNAVHDKHPSYKCWYVTKEGAALHDRIQDMTKMREAAILEGFSKAEVYQLLAYLHRLSANAVALKEIAETDVSSIT